MDRITRDQLNMRIAEMVSERGTCQRGKVGCIITRDGRIVSSGYNGPIGLKHCEELKCDLDKPCQQANHAEMNAIVFAIENKISLDGTKLYCTCAPCYECSEYIRASGIKKVIYREDYRNSDGIINLINHMIEVVQYAD